jgi:putative transposase
MDDDFFDFTDEFEKTSTESAIEVFDDIFSGDDSIEGRFYDDKARDVAVFRRSLIRYLEQRLTGGWTPKNLNCSGQLKLATAL